MRGMKMTSHCADVVPVNDPLLWLVNCTHDVEWRIGKETAESYRQSALVIAEGWIKRGHSPSCCTPVEDEAIKDESNVKGKSAASRLLW